MVAKLSVWCLPEAMQCCGKEIHGGRSAKAVDLKDEPWGSMGGRRKGQRVLRAPERIYSQLGEYFGVTGKGGSWKGEKHLKSQSREGEELLKVKDNDRTSNNSEEYT